MTSSQKETCDSESVSLNDAMAQYHSLIDEMLGDPLLSDIHHHVTINEVKALTALEYGQAMTVLVNRADGGVYPVIVKQDATVFELKKAIRRYVELKHEREGNNAGSLHLSWKYVWKSYWLVFNGEKLKDNNKKLKDYDIRNRDQLSFIKRLN